MLLLTQPWQYLSPMGSLSLWPLFCLEIWHSSGEKIYSWLTWMEIFRKLSLSNFSTSLGLHEIILSDHPHLTPLSHSNSATIWGSPLLMECGLGPLCPPLPPLFAPSPWVLETIVLPLWTSTFWGVNWRTHLTIVQLNTQFPHEKQAYLAHLKDFSRPINFSHSCLIYYSPTFDCTSAGPTFEKLINFEWKESILPRSTVVCFIWEWWLTPHLLYFGLIRKPYGC